MKKENEPKEEVKESVYVPKSDAELKQLAMDLYDGKIFCDRQVKNQSDLSMVFMPIVFGAFADKTEEEVNDIGLIFEYMDKAMPRGINGMPCFGSCRILPKSETEKMFKFFEDYKALKESFAKS